ncbi:polyketide synthase [Heterostelium album PN500]|uniref:Polyketide synthase n=1 Tax=Heterostelium pallidum (strain ATCC 26659 / Pp 5 / PN500) TaxID=670386 RepID=D3BDH9_HETP5|nr:polyketide synthase [Heterostelium album PN500]EFA80623.1 polyketide synthase [Heterostelium album PN500]|eukprot:XP_020432743.1 polyketide synthase [Heterostelium album PN500]
MGMTLYEKSPIYRATVDRVDSIFQQYTGYSLLAKIKSMPLDSQEIFIQTMAQPSLLMFQIGIIELYRYYGIEPSVVVGVSFGEIAAAYVARSITQEEAVRIIYYRSNFSHRTMGLGKTIIIRSNLEDMLNRFRESKISTLLSERMEEVSRVSRSSSILCGKEDDIILLKSLLEDQGISSYILPLPGTFHCSAQDSIRSEVLSTFSDIQGQAPCSESIKWYSTVTGQLKSDGINSSYIYENIREPVNFVGAIDSIVRDIKDSGESIDNYIFIEISPSAILYDMIKDTLPNTTVVSPVFKRKDEYLYFLSSLAQLYCLGFQMNFNLQFSKDEINVYNNNNQLKVINQLFE